ncbi:MAG: hybrid sensor histidine kinase/response regulator [Thermomicrobiales bacterium]
MAEPATDDNISTVDAEPGSAVLRGLDAARYGFAIWSPNRRLIYCNSSFADFYSAAAAILQPGITYRNFLMALTDSGEIIREPDPAQWLEHMQHDFGTPQTISHGFADGRSLEIAQDVDPSGNVTMTVTDVTVVRRGERALRRAKEIAETADQTKSRFLRAANHDLRQPLATLKILIYNCINEDDAAHREDLLHAMDISVSIMEDLLDALLQIGQLDAGKILPRITTFQLSMVFSRLKVQFSHLAREKGLRLRFVDTGASITTDKALLERILSNLIANAIRYTDSGSVLVGCRRRGQFLAIEVRDTGQGIASEHLNRIFDEFYQIADTRKLKSRGLGLGLNIVMRLAELLKHRVGVSSRLSEGSCFTVEVPIGNVWQSQMGEPEINEMVGGEFAGKNALLIEDDAVLRQATKDLLERWGIIVHAVSGLEEANELIETTGYRPQIILSDYSLRGQHGTAVVRQIRDLTGTNVPCIIITADTDPSLIEAIRAQSFPVLIKPVSPPRLRVLMHNILYEPDAEGTATP